MDSDLSSLQWRSATWSRNPSILWADNGESIATTRHVSPDFEVKVLAGAAAVVWILLEHPRQGCRLSDEVSALHGSSEDDVDPVLEHTLRLLLDAQLVLAEHTTVNTAATTRAGR